MCVCPWSCICIKYASPSINPIDTRVSSFSRTPYLSIPLISAPSLVCVCKVLLNVPWQSKCWHQLLFPEGHPNLPHSRHTQSHTENTHKTSYFHWQGFGFTYPSYKTCAAVEKRTVLNLSYTVSTYHVIFSIDSLSCIIQICNLKFSCKVVLCLSVCLRVSLTHHSAGKENIPPGLLALATSLPTRMSHHCN